MIASVLDHLWQSTLFALLAGLLTLAFRANAARVRYGLWLSASVKFLVPFALLTAAGRYLAPADHAAVLLAPAAIDVVQDVALPFSAAALIPAPSPAPKLSLETVVLALWAAGAVAVLSFWLNRFLRIQAALRKAVPLSLTEPLPVPVKTCAAMMEPGLVGIWRPVLLLPEGIIARLSEKEMTAIIAHELCHWRRRDNLTAAIHMLVEALFWFHPLVWWLGARLIAERERACDESVLASGSDPETYAESILKVCRFYVQSPLSCAAGVSGANLKERMERIMINRVLMPMSAAKKSFLATVAAIAFAAPVLAGAAAPDQTVAQVPSAPSRVDADKDCAGLGPTAIVLGCNVLLSRTIADPPQGSGLVLPHWANTSAPPPPSPPLEIVHAAIERAANDHGGIVEMTAQFATDGAVKVTVDRSSGQMAFDEFCQGLITTPQWLPGTVNGVAQPMSVPFKCETPPAPIRSLNWLPPHSAPPVHINSDLNILQTGREVEIRTGGAAMLGMKGYVFNADNIPRAIPDLRLELRNDQGEIIQTATTKGPPDLLGPESVAKFEIRMELTPSSWDFLTDGAPPDQRLLKLGERGGKYATVVWGSVRQ